VRDRAECAAGPHRPQAVLGLGLPLDAPGARPQSFGVMAQRVLGVGNVSLIRVSSQSADAVRERHIEVDADKDVLVIQLQIADG